MPDISYYKHFLRALISMLFGSYDITLDAFIKMIKHNLSPDKKVINYENWLGKIADKILAKRGLNIEFTNVSNYPAKILILNTELYDTGGHTELAVRYTKAFREDYPINIYLTNSSIRSIQTFENLKKCIELKELANDYYISAPDIKMEDKVFEAFSYIINNKITTINANIHMQDAVGAIVLYLVKKYTNININFWNHAEHFYSLGFNFSDTIFTRLKGGSPQTPYLKNCKKTVYVPFLMEEDFKKFPEDDFINEKIKLEIPDGAFITLTGCSMKKLCNEYFYMIRDVLSENKNIYHIFICSMSDKAKEKLIKKYKLDKNRFKIIDFTNNFDFYIQLSDLYIDSFPQGGALTLVDYIRYSKPVIIKINKKEPIRSFEDYLYDGYEFAFETSEGMKKGVLQLANDKKLYYDTSKKVKDYYDKEYSPLSVKEKYKKYIR